MLEESLCELVAKQLKQHQNTMEDKFIVCLNKVTKSFPPLADRYGLSREPVSTEPVGAGGSLALLSPVLLSPRFMNAVFFLLPKFHGVLKTLCLEVVLCRVEAMTELYFQLKSKDFVQVMRHRWVNTSPALGSHWLIKCQFVQTSSTQEEPVCFDDMHVCEVGISEEKVKAP